MNSQVAQSRNRDFCGGGDARAQKIQIETGHGREALEAHGAPKVLLYILVIPAVVCIPPSPSPPPNSISPLSAFSPLLALQNLSYS